MKPGLRIVAWTVFGATLLISLVIGAFVAWLLSEVVPAGSTINIDDERFVVPAFTHAGHYAMAVLAVWAVSLVIVAVAPLLILAGLVVPALLGAVGLALAVLIVALVLWPVFGFVRRRLKSGAQGSTRAATHPTISP